MSSTQTMIDILVTLSHEFGTPDYVKGGGGNTSVKKDSTLWIKPSGTTLGGLSAETLVEIDRKKLAVLYDWTPRDDVQARESAVKDLLLASVGPSSKGRPSVETPMHDCLAATFVIHTHPTLVNGMTCANEGENACKSIFPDALWVGYVDPGYLLSCRVHDEVDSYTRQHGRQPPVIFLENHGLVVSGESADEIRSRHATIMEILRDRYASQALEVELIAEALPGPSSHFELSEILEAIPELRGHAICESGRFRTAEGPMSPDHIVYSKSYALKEEPTVDSFTKFKQAHGYFPQVIECEGGVFGLGGTEEKAALALELAQDGALIEQLAPAFGGIRYLTDEARDFIDNWEVEAFRRQVKL